jgi:4'-phosphopantetheinyl transferase
MTMPSPEKVADAIYVAAVRIDDVPRCWCLPADRPSGPLPAWRTVEYAAARAVLRGLLAAVADSDAAAAPLGVAGNGKPFLVGRPDVTISISHTDGWAAAAVSTAGAAVGVDIQTHMRVNGAFLRRCCQPEVQAQLNRFCPAARDLEMAWIWSVQEACVKATGDGLAGQPWAIPVGIGQRAGVWGNVAWRACRGLFVVPVSCAYYLE